MSSPAFTYQERSTTSSSFASSNLYNLILPSPSHSSLPRSLCSRRPAKWSEVLMNEWPGLLTDFINKLRACRSELENFRALSVGRTPSKERLARAQITERTGTCTRAWSDEREAAGRSLAPPSATLVMNRRCVVTLHFSSRRLEPTQPHKAVCTRRCRLTRAGPRYCHLTFVLATSLLHDHHKLPVHCNPEVT